MDKLNSYYYRLISSATNKAVCSGSVRAKNMDEAYDKAFEITGLQLSTEYYGNGSMLEGCVYRKYLIRGSQKVYLLIGKIIG